MVIKLHRKHHEHAHSPNIEIRAAHTLLPSIDFFTCTPKINKVFVLRAIATNVRFLLLLFADNRAKNYPFIATPLATLGFVLAYLAWVVVIGPWYMRDKKPYNLRSTLIYYNAFQVLLSAYMFYEVRDSYLSRHCSHANGFLDFFFACSILWLDGSKDIALHAKLLITPIITCRKG
jgi:hypothetical protein